MPLAIIKLPKGFSPNYFDKDDSIINEALSSYIDDSEIVSTSVSGMAWRGQDSPILYKFDAEKGTYFYPAHNAYSFSAFAVKAHSVDVYTIIQNVEELVEKDKALFNNIVQQFSNPNDQMKVLINLRMVEFKGEECRFKGTESEVNDKLFFWNFANYFETDSFYVGKDNYSISYGSDSMLDEKVKFGRVLFENIVKLRQSDSKNDWVVFFKEVQKEDC